MLRVLRRSLRSASPHNDLSLLPREVTIVFGAALTVAQATRYSLHRKGGRHRRKLRLLARQMEAETNARPPLPQPTSPADLLLSPPE